MSGAVGSMPSLTRSGRPSSAARRSFSASARSPMAIGANARLPPPQTTGLGRALVIRPPPAAAPRLPERPGPAVGALMNEEANSIRARAIRPTLATAAAVAEPTPAPAPLEPDPRFGPGPRPPKPRLRKLRLAFVLLGLSLVAVVSAAFGLVMAVASALPK